MTIKTGIIIFVMAAAIAGAVPCYCGDEAQIQSMDGVVAAIDWVASTIVIKWLDTEKNTYREFLFSTPEDIKIYKQTEFLDLSGLEIGDWVTVKYQKDPSGTLKALSITVNQ